MCPLHKQACYTDAANQRSAGRAPAETKRCRRCGNTKEAADFYVSKMTADGLQSYCKACYAVASAARRTRNSQEAVSHPLCLGCVATERLLHARCYLILSLQPEAERLPTITTAAA